MTDRLAWGGASCERGGHLAQIAWIVPTDDEFLPKVDADAELA
jgi:hypothetical protein